MVQGGALYDLIHVPSTVCSTLCLPCVFPLRSPVSAHLYGPIAAHPTHQRQNPTSYNARKRTSVILTALLRSCTTSTRRRFSLPNIQLRLFHPSKKSRSAVDYQDLTCRSSVLCRTCLFSTDTIILRKHALLRIRQIIWLPLGNVS